MIGKRALIFELLSKARANMDCPTVFCEYTQALIAAEALPDHLFSSEKEPDPVDAPDTDIYVVLGPNGISFRGPLGRVDIQATSALMFNAKELVRAILSVAATGVSKEKKP